MLDKDAFLQQEVQSASRAKLRWMLIRKAIGLVQQIRRQWQEQQYTESEQWILWVKAIFDELLAGVTDPQNVVAAQISDLYIYLCKLLHEAHQTHDDTLLASIEDILVIEFETWQLFIQNENSTVADGSSTEVRADFGGSTQPPTPTLQTDSSSSEYRPLNLDA